jgi:hypothetical protein
MEVSIGDTEKVIEAVCQLPNIKLVWKCYGVHNIVAILICEKGNEGETITELRQLLSKFSTSAYHISVGFEWDKVDISPY